MAEQACRLCGHPPLSKDEIGLTQKLIDRRAKQFYCLPCLAASLGVTVEELLEKIREFKEAGCPLFL